MVPALHVYNSVFMVRTFAKHRWLHHFQMESVETQLISLKDCACKPWSDITWACSELSRVFFWLHFLLFAFHGFHAVVFCFVQFSSTRQTLTSKIGSELFFLEAVTVEVLAIMRNPFERVGWLWWCYRRAGWKQVGVGSNFQFDCDIYFFASHPCPQNHLCSFVSTSFHAMVFVRVRRTERISVTPCEPGLGPILAPGLFSFS